VQDTIAYTCAYPYICHLRSYSGDAVRTSLVACRCNHTVNLCYSQQLTLLLCTFLACHQLIAWSAAASKANHSLVASPEEFNITWEVTQ